MDGASFLARVFDSPHMQGRRSIQPPRMFFSNRDFMTRISVCSTVRIPIMDFPYCFANRRRGSVSSALKRKRVSDGTLNEKREDRNATIPKVEFCPSKSKILIISSVRTKSGQAKMRSCAFLNPIANVRSSGLVHSDGHPSIRHALRARFM